jgi:predicted kinase
MSQAPLTRAQVRDLSRQQGMADPIVIIWKAVRKCLDKCEVSHEGRGT